MKSCKDRYSAIIEPRKIYFLTQYDLEVTHPFFLLCPIFTQPIITQFHKSLCQNLISFTSKVFMHLWLLRSGMAHITLMCKIPFFKTISIIVGDGTFALVGGKLNWWVYVERYIFLQLSVNIYIYINISILCSNEHYIQILCIFCANNILRVQGIFIANPSELKYYFKVCAESF